MAIINGTNLRDILNGTSLADLIFGNGGNDWLLGNGGADTIRGGAGSDIIEGGAGNDVLFADSNEGGEDVLFGGADSDILVSGSGRDHFNGGDGVDAASWQESSVAVTANLAKGRATSGGVEDTFTQVENLIGSRFNDTLTGDKGRNELFGGDGADKLYGGDGSDKLSGGAGNDTLVGGTGTNNLRGGSGIDTVDYSANTFARGIDVDMELGGVFAGDSHDAISEIEVVRGSNFGDKFLGDELGNQLFGNGGNDMIDGGEGNDILTGGTGADTFVFVAQQGGFLEPHIDSGFDRIRDFDRAEGDRIDLTGHNEATGFADLRSDASQFGTDTHLRLGDDTIVLEDVTLSQLSADMFLF